MSRRDQILAMHGVLKEVEAEMPGPDGAVKIIVRELIGRDAQEFESAQQNNRPNQLGMLLQLSIVDPDTKERLFEVGDRAILEELGMTTLKPVIEKIMGLLGVTAEELEKIKANLAATH